MQINPINFTSRHIKTINAKKPTGETETLNFVEYEDDLDAKQFEKAIKKEIKPEIVNTMYRDYIKSGKSADGKKEARFYGFEDKNGEVQALCELKLNGDNIPIQQKPKKGFFELAFLYTKSTNRHGAKNREYQGLGTKMVSEIIGQSKELGAKQVAIINVNRNFWRNIPYFKNRGAGDTIKVLDKRDFNDCILKLNA